MPNKEDIPKGKYCYQMDPFGDPDLNGGEMPIISCPFSTYKNIDGVNVPWCSFLDKGGVDNNITNEEHSKLVRYFGTEEKMDKVLPLDLLWDSVKECGENDG